MLTSFNSEMHALLTVETPRNLDIGINDAKLTVA